MLNKKGSRELPLNPPSVRRNHLQTLYLYTNLKIKFLLKRNSAILQGALAIQRHHHRSGCPAQVLPYVLKVLMFLHYLCTKVTLKGIQDFHLRSGLKSSGAVRLPLHLKPSTVAFGSMAVFLNSGRYAC